MQRTSDSLTRFITHAREKGMDHQTIRMLLLSSGWKEKDIATAMASQSLELPVPIPSDGGSARDAFLHLLGFTTLYATVISLIVLVYQFIERMFEDPAFSETPYTAVNDTSTIRWSLSVILVSYPLFVYVSRVLRREASEHSEKLVSGVRRWLTYLTLFVTACTIAGDFITLLFFLLQGELTTRFVLKALAVLILSGIPFLYYLRTMKLDPDHYATSPLHRRYLFLTSVIVLTSIIWSLFSVGSPGKGRIERFDEQRISDLRLVQNEMLNYLYGSARWDTANVNLPVKALPDTLDPVAEGASYERLRTLDPETRLPYEYRPSKTSYELCATFGLPRNQDYDIFWNHPAGRHCFTFDPTDRQGK